MYDQNKNGSTRVVGESSALDFDESFVWKNPQQITLSLKCSIDANKRRKSSSYRFAVSMLVFCINRAGNNPESEQKSILEAVKIELRKRYSRS